MKQIIFSSGIVKSLVIHYEIKHTGIGHNNMAKSIYYQILADRLYINIKVEIE